MKRRASILTFLTIALATSGIGYAAAPAQAAALPSVFCDFEEPFQWIVVSSEGVLVEDHENGARFTRYRQVSARGSIDSTMIITLPKASKAPQLVLTKQDGIRSHLAEFDGRQGECTAYPSGFVIRKVTGVATGDQLNIRAKASASAEVIGTAGNGTLIWVKPSKSSWLQAAFVDSPGADEASGDEPEFVRVGWVRGNFVTKKVPAIAHN